MAQAITSAWKIIPQFRCRSVTATAQFYGEELNFAVSIPDPNNGAPTFCSVFVGKQAAANIYFMQADVVHPSAAMIALGTTELDEFYEHVKGKQGIVVKEAIEDKPWGYRQFTMLDGDGNELTFFRFLEGGNPGTE